MKVCKVVPSAELSSEEEPSLKSLHRTPEDAAARDKDAWQELHLAWVFSPCSSAENVQLHPSIQWMKPKWLQLHSRALSLMCSTGWSSMDPVTAMWAHMGQHGTRGLSTDSPVQWGCCPSLGCCQLAWVWKHVGQVHKNQQQHEHKGNPTAFGRPKSQAGHPLHHLFTFNLLIWKLRCLSTATTRHYILAISSLTGKKKG